MRNLIALVMVAGFLQAEEPKKPAPVVVPIELLPSGHFVVTAKINDKGSFRFILDTGAPLTIINSKTAKESGLTKKAGGGGGLLSMLTSNMAPMTVNTMEIGSVTAEKTTAVVMDHPTVSAISKEYEKTSGPIEGLIGFPFFARYAMTVDYQKKELTFTPNGYKPGDYMDDLTKRLMDTDELSKPRTIAPAGLWGFEVDKGKTDEDAGVTVTKVYADGPMGVAGLKVGDRILTIDRRWTDSIGDAAVATQSIKPGTSTEVKVLRDGKEMTLKATPVKGK
jgi:Aspartyl protease/PDZ domain